MSINRDEWLQALTEAGYTDEHDEQAVTLMEFAAMFGICRTTAQCRLAALVAAGKASITHKWATNTRGARIQFRAYRLADRRAKRKGKAA